MTKGEFITSLVDDYNLLREDAAKITKIVFSQIRDKLVEGREVRIDKVGSFSFKYYEPQIVNNNLIGQRHEVGPRIKLTFTPFPSMKFALNRKLAKEIEGASEKVE